MPLYPYWNNNITTILGSRRAYLLGVVVICILSVLFPQHDIRLQTNYTKNAITLDLPLGKASYVVQPIPFIAHERTYDFGIRITDVQHYITASDPSVFIAAGEAEFFTSNMVYTTVTHSKLPQTIPKTLDIKSIESQGTTQTFYHFSVIILIILALLLPNLWQAFKIIFIHPQGYIFLVCLIGWGAFLLWAATNLPYYHGPDETRHFFGGAWYFNHILPISLNDNYFKEPVWGSNYLLVSADLSYLFNFKLTLLLERFVDAPLFILVRYAQILIVLSIVLLTVSFVGYGQAFFMLGIYAIIPQATYLNLYISQDGYSLAACMFALLYARYGTHALRTRMCIAILLILNTRTHYLICLLPLAYFYFEQRRLTLKACLQDIPWTALAFAVGGYKIWFMWWDQWQHHTNYMQVAMQYASDAIKLKYHHVSDGDTNCALFTYLPWYWSTFRSFFGAFGLMDYIMPFSALSVCLALLVYLLTSIRSKDGFILLLLLVVNVSLSLLYSAGYDYQAQGRYIFPFLATVPAMMHTYEKRMVWLVPLGLFITITSIYNFMESPLADHGMRIVLNGEVVAKPPIQEESFCFRKK